VYAPCWSRVREERWSISCRKGCPEARRSLVKPSTFACTRTLPISRTTRFARHADERNVGCVYHQKCSSIKRQIACKLIQEKQNKGLLRNPCPPPRPGESTPARPNHAPLSRVLTSPAQPCPPFTCTHPFQPPTLARTLSTKSPNSSTLALFWILNSPCTSQLWKPYAVLPRVRPLL